MKLFLRIKQLFCKHEMEHILTETRKRKLINAMYICKEDTYEIYECSKCGKRELIRIPKFTSTIETRYDNYLFGKSKRNRR